MLVNTPAVMAKVRATVEQINDEAQAAIAKTKADARNTELQEQSKLKALREDASVQVMNVDKAAKAQVAAFKTTEETAKASEKKLKASVTESIEEVLVELISHISYYALTTPSTFINHSSTKHLPIHYASQCNTPQVKRRGHRAIARLQESQTLELSEKKGIKDAVAATKAKFAKMMKENNAERDSKIVKCKADTEASIAKANEAKEKAVTKISQLKVAHVERQDKAAARAEGRNADMIAKLNAEETKTLQAKIDAEELGKKAGELSENSFTAQRKAASL